MLILSCQSWSTNNSLGSNWQQDVHNLHTGCGGSVGFQIWKCNIEFCQKTKKKNGGFYANWAKISKLAAQFAPLHPS